ncbi:MAG: VOC family protein [Paracoccaceae bacterium]|nr:VOC family protein [Paracoccaceae bacterium]
MITGIDHIVLTVRDIERSAAFYERVLKMEVIIFGEGRRALRFGTQKINLQTLGQETRNYAGIGSGDLCLITEIAPKALLAHLAAAGVTVIEGPVEKSGALGPITSVYFNDPDGNLVEVSSYS